MRVFLPLLSMLLATTAAMSQPGKSSSTPAQEQASPQLLSIRSLLHGEQHDGGNTVLLRGTITYTGSPVIIQDQTGAIGVQASSPGHLTLGDEAEVRGVDSVANGIHTIEHARIDSLWHSSPPAPLAITPDLAAEGEYDHYLVEVEGTLVKREPADNNTLRLSLEGGHQFFSAIVSGDSSGVSLDPGSIVQLTGVLLVHKMHFGLQSGSFTLLLRSAQDIRVVQAPPWWTPSHIAILALLLLPLAALIHLVRLGAIRRRFDAITSERARIARDIHDTLAQGFAGIAFQLEGATQEMERDQRTAQNHLNMALSMVRHSRTEAHRAISTLRSSSQELPLEKMIEDMVSQMSLGSRIKIHIHVLGDSRQLAASQCDHLFRLTQEAVSNAIQHAQASNIWIALNYLGDEALLQISDDGRGFDLDSVAGPQSGHFGLTGIRERADRINASFEISSSNMGTKLTICVPNEKPRPKSSKLGLRRWRSHL